LTPFLVWGGREKRRNNMYIYDDIYEGATIKRARLSKGIESDLRQLERAVGSRYEYKLGAIYALAGLFFGVDVWRRPLDGTAEWECVGAIEDPGTKDGRVIKR
jgi:hypothetical protein